MRLIIMSILLLLPWMVFASKSNAMPHLLTWPQLSLPKSKQLDAVTHHDPTISCVLLHSHYIDRSMLSSLLKQKKAGWLSNRGSVQLIAKTHQISLCDDVKHRQRFIEILKQLDQPPQQIRIRARIVSVDRQYLRDLGIHFSSVSKNKDGAQQMSGEANNNDLSSGGMQFVLATLNAQQLLMMQLHALVQHGHANIIASPTLLTSNNHAATIESGEEVPYQQGTLSGATSVAFKKAVMQLAVTPQIIQHQRVILNLKIHQDKVTPLSVNGVPIISTEQMQTSAIIHNKATLVIGGVVEKKTSDTTQGVPVLQHLPILGFAFRHHHKQIESRELLIFIRPQW